MSIHVDDLRENCGLLGELAADEIEDLEKAYESQFKEIGALKAELAALRARVAELEGVLADIALSDDMNLRMAKSKARRYVVAQKRRGASESAGDVLP